LNKSNELLAQLISGSQSSLEKLYNIHSRQIYQVSYYIVKDKTIAEEIVQDSFLQLWNMRSKLDAEGNLATLLYVIARNRSFNKLRQLLKERKVFHLIAPHDEYDHFQERNLQEVNELNEIIEVVIKKLPERQQLIFRLSRLEGLPHMEIADTLNISIQTVKNQMVNAQKKIKKELIKLQNDQNIGYTLILFLTGHSTLSL